MRGSSKGRPGSFTRLLRLSFTFYLWAAAAYTALQFFVLPLWHSVLPQHSPSIVDLRQGLQLNQISNNGTAAATPAAARPSRWSAATDASQDSKSELKGSTSDAQKQKSAKEVLAWHAPTHELAQAGPGISTGGGSSLLKSTTDSVSMSEDFFLNKAFGETLQPSKVIPYYYRASKAPEQEDITITTLITPNRFKVFADLVERYQGPISVTIHVSNNDEQAKLLKSLDQLYTTAPYMSTYVDVHLVLDAFDRQFNMWRNVARFFARTDYVMMLDVDFWLCTDFRSRILSSPAIMDRLREGNAAFVIPAFEFAEQDDGLDSSTFPNTKSDLMKLVQDSKIDMFHKAWQPGHGSTNYTRYYLAPPGEDFYKAQGYTHSYEPYVVFKKQGTPYCDERFIGYGGNKAACLYELYLSGVSYYVLPDDFLIHQSHAYAEKARQHERRYNRKLYTDFREELCFRYLNQFVDANAITEPRAKNLMIECKKIKGFTAAAQEIIAEQASKGSKKSVSSSNSNSNKKAVKEAEEANALDRR